MTIDTDVLELWAGLIFAGLKAAEWLRRAPISPGIRPSRATVRLVSA